jgi:hypothetical protein
MYRAREMIVQVHRIGYPNYYLYVNEEDRNNILDFAHNVLLGKKNGKNILGYQR